MLGRPQAGDVADQVSGISRWLIDLYALDLDLDAQRFVLEPSQAANWLPKGPRPRTGVVVSEESDGMSIGLFVDVADATDLGTLVEETSHLVCIAWHAHRDRPLSRLWLELQADIDRFLFRRLGADTERRTQDPFGPHRWADWVDCTTKVRYRAAWRAARRYCGGLDRRFPSRSDVPALLSEVRTLYRASSATRMRRARA